MFTDDIDLKVKRNLSGERTEVANAEDPSRTVVARFTVQPGAQFPWHSHAGSVVVNIVEGALVYVGADDCVEREYPAGTAFVDLGHGDVHTAFNATDDVTVLVATFFEAPEAGPLLMPAETPADCAILGRPTRSLPPAATAGAGRTRPNGSDELPDRDGTGRSDRDVGLRDLSGGSVRLVDDRLQGLDPLEERSDGEVVRERLFVLVAGRPDLLPVRGVQPGVVPDDRPGRGGPAALGRADRGGRFVVHWASLSAGVTLRPPADPALPRFDVGGLWRARFPSSPVCCVRSQAW